eukprot:TRINITY_DN2320_c0_g1_i4.p1 TRINITY_DN2320_c0_g1~~TRINITY_DN2320_c0_g1_i4.p1  ORF type:complete len:981 (-),score=188.83 TRINITY_DN2320_c0_g1_i4:888-3830(-)
MENNNNNGLSPSIPINSPTMTAESPPPISSPSITSSQHRIYDEQLIPIVFVPGLKGSSLINKEGKKIWLSKMQALGLECPRLDLPLEWQMVEDDPDDPDKHLIWRQKADGVRAGRVVKQLAKISIYRNFVTECKNKGRAFYEFAYDWRRDVNEAAHQLAKLLQQIYSHHKVPIQVVSHSMGGLVTYAVVNDPKFVHLFHSALFVGTPFSQEIAFLEFVHAGLAEGLNEEILSPQVLFTCPSGGVFYPFTDNPKVFGYKDRTKPPKQRPADPRFQTDAHDEEIEQRKKFLEDFCWLAVHDVDYYDPEDWLRQKIGIYSIDYQNFPWKVPPGTPPKDILKVLFDHQRCALHQAGHFRSRIRYNPNINYPPMAVLRTTCIPTLSRVLKDGPKSVRGFDFETLPKSEGDGRVVASATLLPRGVPHEVYTTKLDHTFQMNDPNIFKIMSELTSYGGDTKWYEKPKPETISSKSLIPDQILRKLETIRKLSIELRPFKKKSQNGSNPKDAPNSPPAINRQYSHRRANSTEPPNVQKNNSGFLSNSTPGFTQPTSTPSHLSVVSSSSSPIYTPYAETPSLFPNTSNSISSDTNSLLLNILSKINSESEKSEQFRRDVTKKIDNMQFHISQLALNLGMKFSIEESQNSPPLSPGRIISSASEEAAHSDFDSNNESGLLLMTSEEKIITKSELSFHEAIKLEEKGGLEGYLVNETPNQSSNYNPMEPRVGNDGLPTPSSQEFMISVQTNDEDREAIVQPILKTANLKLTNLDEMEPESTSYLMWNQIQTLIEKVRETLQRLNPIDLRDLNESGFKALIVSNAKEMESNIEQRFTSEKEVRQSTGEVNYIDLWMKIGTEHLVIELKYVPLSYVKTGKLYYHKNMKRAQELAFYEAKMEALRSYEDVDDVLFFSPRIDPDFISVSEAKKHALDQGKKYAKTFSLSHSKLVVVLFGIGNEISLSGFFEPSKSTLEQYQQITSSAEDLRIEIG